MLHELVALDGNESERNRPDDSSISGCMSQPSRCTR
jgi:hypothetical protein